MNPPTATDYELAEAAILAVMERVGTADAASVLREAAAQSEPQSRDALTGALQTLVGRRQIRLNSDLKLELVR